MNDPWWWSGNRNVFRVLMRIANDIEHISWTMELKWFLTDWPYAVEQLWAEREGLA